MYKWYYIFTWQVWLTVGANYQGGIANMYRVYTTPKILLKISALWGKKYNQQLKIWETIEFTPDAVNFCLPLSKVAIGREESYQHRFSLKGEQFFFLWNESTKRRIVFTNGLLQAGDSRRCSAVTILGVQICNEWDKILECCTQQLNYAVCTISPK